MAKGKTSEGKPSGAPPLPNKDLLHRLNFTYQASIFLQQIGEASTSASSSSSSPRHPSPPAADKKGKRKATEAEMDKQEVPDVDFARLARQSMLGARKMGVHNQMKSDPSLKRSICKNCATILIPGLTCRIRNRPNQNHMNIAHQTCLACSKRLSLPCPPTADLPLDTSLDGPVRKRRRERSARNRKLVFYLREGGKAGHKVWAGDGSIEGWGVRREDCA